MSKRLICTYGDKGGVGKSMTARVLAETMMAAGKVPLLVDADPTVGHLVGYLGVRDADGYPVIPQPANGVLTYALHGSADDRVEFGAILGAGHDLILVDLPAASATLLRAVEADYGLFAYAHERGYEVTFVCAITPDGSSMLAVQDAAALDPLATIIAVKNLGFGDPKHFIVWDGSDVENVSSATGKTIVAEKGAEIVLPALDRGTLALIGLWRLTFADATKSEHLIGPRQRQVARFLDEARGQFETIGPALGFGDAKKRSAA